MLNATDKPMILNIFNTFVIDIGPKLAENHTINEDVPFNDIFNKKVEGQVFLKTLKTLKDDKAYE